jgi:hypothetical protein
LLQLIFIVENWKKKRMKHPIDSRMPTQSCEKRSHAPLSRKADSRGEGLEWLFAGRYAKIAPFAFRRPSPFSAGHTPVCHQAPRGARGGESVPRTSSDSFRHIPQRLRDMSQSSRDMSQGLRDTSQDLRDISSRAVCSFILKIERPGNPRNGRIGVRTVYKH